MRIFLICLSLMLTCGLSAAQVVAVKTKMHCWSDPKHDFFGSLTPNGRLLLDSLFKIAPVDTVNCIRLNWDEGFELMKRPIMSTRKYRSYSIISDHGVVWTTSYENEGISYYPDKPRVILKYIKDFNLTIDKLVLVIFE